jgi:hypothetical protein
MRSKRRAFELLAQIGCTTPDLMQPYLVQPFGAVFWCSLLVQPFAVVLPRSQPIESARVRLCKFGKRPAVHASATISYWRD